MFESDELDRKILAILQEDGRASHVNIARRLGVGHTRVRDRILKMEEAGVIAGYQVVLNPVKLGHDVECVVQLEVDQRLDFDQLARQLLQIDEVVEVINLTGPVDAHVRVWARDIAHLREILYNKLSTLPAHKSTSSAIVLKQWKKSLGVGG
ncbi:MAG: Lrp/AsnC family transcriptional regulator [Anaerolineae bacterium]